MPADQDKYILAVDLGTSGLKVALVSSRGDVVGCEIEALPLFLLPDGGAEQHPDDWWNGIKNATRRLVGSGLVPIDEIVAVSCTAQWSGTVAVDRGGYPLMKAIIWMDSRGARYVKRVTGGPITVEGYGIEKLLIWLRLTGGIPAHSGKDSIAHILYIRNELPEIYRQTYKFLEPKDYLNLRLTGRYAASYDSIALHWVTDNRNITQIVYDERLLKMVALEREKLPDLQRAIDILGPIKPEVAAELGLNEKVQVVVGTPDVHSAAIGAGAVRDYEGHLYIGTSSWLTCHVPFKKTDILHNMASLPSPIPGRYFIANEQECAGVCLDVLRDNILYHRDELAAAPPHDVYDHFNEVAARVPAGSDKLIFTPWLYGERTPVEDRFVRGGFFNQSLKTTREHFIRAVFEGVAYNSRWLLGSVERFARRRLDPINMIGGGANSNLWCQIHADVLDRTIRQVKAPIWANARGAALLASTALGYITLDEIREQVQIANTYEPNPENREIYDELFKEFVNLYKKNRGIYARLNRAV
ncbi:MAG: FGGY-family carbohydrate kinase [Ardenticatenaceae bacterium]|nr:FGGY-family carbohydrate kinase [Ardenticatenaceae bacterium]